MASIYVIPIDVHVPDYPADDAAEGDELEMVMECLQEAILGIHLAGVTLRLEDPQYRGKV